MTQEFGVAFNLMDDPELAAMLEEQEAAIKKYDERIKKWDVRFLKLAEHISHWSKDPSTKVGCVITDAYNRVMSVGYNGFPREVEDREDRLGNRPTKYRYMVHGDMNAILHLPDGAKGMWLCMYTWPFPPCATCAGAAIQAGIKRVCSPATVPSEEARWGEDIAIAKTMFEEADVEYNFDFPKILD